MFSYTYSGIFWKNHIISERVFSSLIKACVYSTFHKKRKNIVSVMFLISYNRWENSHINLFNKNNSWLNLLSTLHSYLQASTPTLTVLCIVHRQSMYIMYGMAELPTLSTWSFLYGLVIPFEIKLCFVLYNIWVWRLDVGYWSLVVNSCSYCIIFVVCSVCTVFCFCSIRTNTTYFLVCLKFKI